MMTGVFKTKDNALTTLPISGYFLITYLTTWSVGHAAALILGRRNK
jgi:hypothetical protein